MNTADILVETLGWKVTRLLACREMASTALWRRCVNARKEFSLSRRAMRKLGLWMACAHAKYTGRLGICVATLGPGGIHLLNGLYDAKCDGAPVLAITGLHHRDLVVCALTTGYRTRHVVGSSFPYMEFPPKPGNTRAVQIDRNLLRPGDSLSKGLKTAAVSSRTPSILPVRCLFRRWSIRMNHRCRRRLLSIR